MFLLGTLLCTGCGSTDGGPLLRPMSGAGGETAGASGSGGTPSHAGAGGGQPGFGSRGFAFPDAGSDTTLDAGTLERSCVVGSLDEYCAAGSDFCPVSYAGARTRLRSFAQPGGVFILQEFCTAPDGTERLLVSGVYGALSLTYIYDPAAGQLVSVHISNDSEICSSPLERGDAGFDWFAGFYGPALPNCAIDSAHFELPSQCGMPSGGGNLDAGAVRDAGADAGSFEDGDYECILAP